MIKMKEIEKYRLKLCFPISFSLVLVESLLKKHNLYLTVNFQLFVQFQTSFSFSNKSFSLVSVYNCNLSHQ